MLTKLTFIIFRLAKNYNKVFFKLQQQLSNLSFKFQQSQQLKHLKLKSYQF